MASIIEDLSYLIDVRSMAHSHERIVGKEFERLSEMDGEKKEEAL